MRFTRLVLEDYRSYAYTDIEFGPLSNVVVVGKNGHGKSALLEAIMWAIDGRTRSKTADHIVRHGAELARVRLEFTDDGIDYVIVREQPLSGTATLGFWTTDGAEPKMSQHSIKETTAAIEKIIGLSREGLEAGPIMVQKNAAKPSLMKSLPAKRKDVLAELLDLSIYPPLHESAKSERAEAAGEYEALNRQHNNLAVRIADNEEELQVLPDKKVLLAAETEAQSLAAERIKVLTVQLASANERIRRHSDLETREHALLTSLTAERAEKARLVALLVSHKDAVEAKEPSDPVVAAPDPARVVIAERMLAEAQQAGRDAAALGQRHHAAEVALVSAKENHARLERVPCHGIGKYADCVFLTSAKGADVPAVEALVGQLTAEWNRAKDKAHTESSIERTLSTLRRTRQEAAVSAERAEAAHRRWEDRRQNALRAIEETTTLIGAATDRIAAAGAELDRVVAEKAAIEEDFLLIRQIESDSADAQTVYEAHKVAADAALTEVRHLLELEALVDRDVVELHQLRVQVDETEAKGKTFRTLMEAFHRDGIPTMIMEGAIPLISARANEVLALMPDDFTVEMVTERATKGGGMADEIDIIVTKGGWAMDYEDLSSAQQFRVDFAIRMGLTQLLTHRSGKRIETLWLDEPDADLDEEGREALMECLAAVEDEFSLIVVASHHTFLTDRFPARIETRMIDAISTAEVAA